MSQAARPSQPFTLANTNMEVSSDSMGERSPSEDFVSFYNVMDATKRVVDTFEDSVCSRVSDPEVRRCHVCLAQAHRRLYRILQAYRHRQPIFSPKNSKTKFNSERQLSISINDPQIEKLYDCACSHFQNRQEPFLIQGRQELVFIYMSSDSKEDVDID